MTSPQPLPAPHRPLHPAERVFLRIKKAYGMYTGNDLDSLVHKDGEPDIVPGWLPARSVNLMVGDSGVGKTALAYQLALSVAAGLPFLGAAPRKGKVLVLDFENGSLEWNRMLKQQRKFLGLAKYPSPNFVFWPVHGGTPHQEVRQTIRTMSPDLVIVDSLRSYNAWIEGGNGPAAREIKELRAMVQDRGMAALLIHHVQKNAEVRGSLDRETALDWLRYASGGRAIVNQTDARLALAASKEREGWVVMRGHLRTRGDTGPTYLRRRYDQDGEPLGYEHVPAVASFLGNAQDEAAFANLPEAFTFREAKEVLGKCDDSTNSLLHRFMRAGILRKVDRGKYAKYKNAGEAGGTQ